jgi:hypothetical protein
VASIIERIDLGCEQNLVGALIILIGPFDSNYQQVGLIGGARTGRMMEFKPYYNVSNFELIILNSST